MDVVMDAVREMSVPEREARLIALLDERIRLAARLRNAEAHAWGVAGQAPTASARKRLVAANLAAREIEAAARFADEEIALLRRVLG